jgi:hypothetical protein
VAIGDLGSLGSLSLFAWLVPSFFVGMPGLLIILVLAGQLVAGAIFLPLTRRVLGVSGLGRRRRRTA